MNNIESFTSFINETNSPVIRLNATFVPNQEFNSGDNELGWNIYKKWSDNDIEWYITDKYMLAGKPGLLIKGDNVELIDDKTGKVSGGPFTVNYIITHKKIKSLYHGKPNRHGALSNYIVYVVEQE